MTDAMRGMQLVGLGAASFVLLACGSSARVYSQGGGGQAGSVAHSEGGASGASGAGAASTGGRPGFGGAGSGGASDVGGAGSGGASDVGGAGSSGASVVGGAGTSGASDVGGAGSGGAPPCAAVTCTMPPSGHGQATCSGGSCGLTCNAGYSACSTDCVALAADAANCGTCGHSCGTGASCSGGKCQAVALAPNLSNAYGLDVSADGVYFTASGGVFSCGLTSCSATGPQQIGAGFGTTLELVVTRGLSPNRVAFHGTPATPGPNDFLYDCPVSGCAATVPYTATWGGSSQSGLGSVVALSGNVYYLTEGSGGSRILRCSGTDFSSCVGLAQAGQPSNDTYIFAVDDTNLYYFAAGAANDDLVPCKTSTVPCTPGTALSKDIFLPGQIVAYGGQVYWWAGKSGDPLLRCAAAGCANSPSTIVNVVGSLTQLFVDASGIYWITDAGLLNKCPLSGCPGTGPTTITSGITGAQFLKVQGTSAYWLGSSAVYRIGL